MTFSDIDPVTPAYADTYKWITTYITIHSLSIPSRRYSLLLWLAILVVSFAFTVLHWSGVRGEIIDAVFSKWSLHRTIAFKLWRKNHNLATSNPDAQSNRQFHSSRFSTQLLPLSLLTLVALILAFVGPDYLDPTLKIWQFRTQSPHANTSTFMSCIPLYTISKSLWSSSARIGQITFALFPLCVLFALKSPPFAVFAIPFMMQLCFDKLAYLHKWTARLIWLLVLVHVVLWSIQLTKDVNPSTGRVAYVYAWSYTPFIFGWIAFTLLSLIILLSLRPIRKRFYDQFYVMHILLVPCMLLMAGLHHPSVAWWCWVALGIWIGERAWRGSWWSYVNNIICGIAIRKTTVPFESPSVILEMHERRRSSTESHVLSPIDQRAPSPLDAYCLGDENSFSAGPDTHSTPLRPSISHLFNQSVSGSTTPHSWHSYIPPPGYVHAELLSGCTIRLRLVTPRFLSWPPGQHFLLSIPSISRFSSHPFTCGSICDAAAQTGAGRVMLFLVRGRDGWTKELWRLISKLITEKSNGDGPLVFPSDRLPKNGVLLRAYVDGPFGTVARVRWGSYSTAIIIVGGSGVSFGLSLLQYMSMCLAGRDGRQLGAQPGGWRHKDTVLKRVRLVWLVREYSHIQWCASVIRYCMSIVPVSALQVDIYVTNIEPVPSPGADSLVIHSNSNELQCPNPGFVRSPSVHSCSRPTKSVESHESRDSGMDLPYYLGRNKDERSEDLHAPHILDLANSDSNILSSDEAHLDSHPLLPPGSSSNSSQPELEMMDEQERRDIDVVSKHARPGKPRLDKVITDEVEASEGSVVVACCGPISLNAMVRKHVSSQTDLGRIRRGDMRGSITFISEEFDY